MRKPLLALAVAALAVGTTAATQKSDPLATVNAFVVAFNKGDSVAAIAMCAEETSIIDEFAPHEWHGAGACARWIGDFDADANKNKITDPVVTLHKPTHVDVTGDVAYIVAPADYVFKQNGKKMKETNSVLTVSLEKGATGWVMTGWAWAKH